VDLETGETPDPEAPLPIENPTATDYARWARHSDEALDRWVAAENDEKTTGVAVRAMFCDMMTAGNILLLEPLGFAVLIPGPIIILGGKGKLLRSDSTELEAYLVLDGASRTWSLAGGAKLKVPQSGEIVDGQGSVEAFFSLPNPRDWFLNFGTRREPNKAKIIQLMEAKAFLQIDHYRITFGVDVTWSLEGPPGLKKILLFFIKGGLGIYALIGWNPGQFAAEVSLHGEAGVKIFSFITISFSMSVVFFGHVPKPKILRGTLTFKLKLPFPLRSPEIKLTFPDIEEDEPPPTEPALQTETRQEVHVGALHGLTGRQWDLDEPEQSELNQPWPDSELVVHFSRQTIDATGKILGEPVAAENNGGYEVRHTLNALEIFDLANDVEIGSVEAVWAEAPDGSTGQLHVLAQDPYSWLFWSQELTSSLSFPPPQITLQRFGIGPDETFDSERRFGDIRIAPEGEATLSNRFNFVLSTRTISAVTLRIVFGGGPVDRIVLYVIHPAQAITTFLGGGINVSAGGQVLGLNQIQSFQLSQGVYLLVLEATLPPDTAVEEIILEAAPSGGQVIGFHLYAVRFRKAPQPVGSCQERVVLTPGRYRLRVEGETSAESLHGLSNPEPIPWELSREFQIVYPPSLRPYLNYTTVGDSRLFRNENAEWNPTLYGIGFPAYRAYLPVLRFLTSYISRIFPILTVQIRYVEMDNAVVELSGEPTENPDGESSTLAPSAEFRDWLGCDVQRDQEVALEPLPFSGSAEVRVLFNPPNQPAVILDSWECYVSQFESFTEHLMLTNPGITTYYDANGPHALELCFTPGFAGGRRLSIGGNHIDANPRSYTALPIPRVIPGPLLPGEYPSVTTDPFPEELAAPPLPWRLPSSVASPLNDSAPVGISYARFAHDTGARFSADPANPLFGINNTVFQTRIDAIEDDAGRLFALWLRSPEPLDWRRVSLALRIRHLQGGSPCPADYAYRRPLDLDVEALPSPDGSSAFLVGRLAGIRTRLPRGEYALTISFNPSEAGLPKLRPSAAVGSPETLELKFLNLSGPDWPLPTEAVMVPAGLLASLVERAGVSDPSPDEAPVRAGERLRPGAASAPGARYLRRRRRTEVLAAAPREE
jgi:hypothetical protein